MAERKDYDDEAEFRGKDKGIGLVNPIAPKESDIQSAYKKKKKEDAIREAIDNRPWYEKFFGTSRPYKDED